MGNRQATDEIGKLLDIKGVPLEEYCAHLDSSARAEQQELRGFARSLVRRCITDAAIAEPLLQRLGEDRPEKSHAENTEGKSEASSKVANSASADGNILAERRVGTEEVIE